MMFRNLVRGWFLVGATVVLAAWGFETSGIGGCGGGGGGSADDDVADDDADDDAADDDDGDDNDDDESPVPLGLPETISVTLGSSSLFDLSALAIPSVGAQVALEEESEPCSVAAGSEDVRTDGRCLTPISISGQASAITLGGAGVAPARIFGSTVGDTGLDRGGELEVGPFDLASPVALQGESNLEDSGNDSWELVAIYLALLDVKVQVKQQFWTVRFAFVSSPVSSEEALDGCLDEHYAEALAQNGVLMDGETALEFRRGDILFCIKENADDACAPSDFQWGDQDALMGGGNVLVSTRPANPLQHEWEAVEDPVSCESEEGAGYNIRLGTYDLVANLGETLQLSATRQECQRVYQFTDSDTNETTTGNTVSIDFDFGMAGSVFLPGVMESDLSTVADGNLFNAFTLAQMYNRVRGEEPDATAGDMGLTASVDVTVTNDDSLTCLGGDEIPEELDNQSECNPEAEVKDEGEDGCLHDLCTPDFQAVEGTVWSQQSYEDGSGNSCDLFCTKQNCPEYNGAWKSIYCIPDCTGDSGGDDGDDDSGDDSGGDDLGGDGEGTQIDLADCNGNPSADDPITDETIQELCDCSGATEEECANVDGFCVDVDTIGECVDLINESP